MIQNNKIRDNRGRYTKQEPSNDKPVINSRMMAHLVAEQEVVINAMLQRTGLIRQLMDNRRDIDDECGYLKTEELDIGQYKLMYDREPVAAKVVDIFPRESWKRPPAIYEVEDSEQETTFEAAWKDLSKQLRGESWFSSQEGNPIWEHLRRADEISGIGTYGVLLLGLDDGGELGDPAVPSDSLKLLYLRAYDEEQAQIASYENDEKSPRYGLPTAYNIQLFDATPGVGSSGTMGLQNRSVSVHWTRIIHVADNLKSSEVFGIPRMQKIWNRLHDLQKEFGGSAEMYWRGAFPGIALETHPQLGGDVALDESAVKDMMENYMNGLQRYIFLGGLTANSLPPQIVDPTNWIDNQITAICIFLRCPKRIFMGSERGELSSGQDAQAWRGEIEDRQINYLSPRLISVFVDRLISLKVLPEPEEYFITWPNIYVAGEEEKSKVALTKTEAMVKYIQGNAEALITPVDYLTRVMDFTQEEAIEIAKAAAEEAEEQAIEEEELFGEEPTIPQEGGPEGASDEGLGIGKASKATP